METAPLKLKVKTLEEELRKQKGLLVLRDRRIEYMAK